MKLNLLFKCLTLVGFLLTGSVGLAQTTTPAGAPTFFAAPNNDALCLDPANRDKNPVYYDNKCGRPEGIGSCSESKKDYLEKLAKEKEACSGFTQERGNNGRPISCSQKYANCQAQMNGVFNDGISGAGSSDGTNQFMQFATQMATNSLLGNSGAAAQATPTNCINEFDPKTVRDADKDLAKEKKELEKEIKKEKEEQIKLARKITEKQDDIKKKTAELEAEAKKEILSKDKKISEETAAVAKNTIEIGKRIRAYSIAINKKNQEMASNDFSYQTAMLEYTDEKVSMQCKQQFESLKAAIIKSRSKSGGLAANATPEDKKNFETLSAMIGTEGGVRASANASSFLNATRKACFEKAETAKNTNMLKHSQATASLNSDIQEINKSIADEKAGLDADSKRIQTLQQQTDKEKSADEAEKLTKLSNLNEELRNFSASITEEVTLSKAQADKLTNDIKALVLKTNFNAKPAMTDAAKAISAYQIARNQASVDCCSDTKSKNSDFCKQIASDKSKEPFDGKNPEKPSSYPTGNESADQ